MRTATISFHTSGNETSLAHNNRTHISNNVDVNKTKDNIYIKQQPILEAYEHVFGEAINKYNEKQKRKDRLMSSKKLLDKNINSTKIKHQREAILQIGNKDDYSGDLFSFEEGKKMLIDCYDNFVESNPNFYVYNAVIHMDEETPHLHINYIPYFDKDMSNGKSRGLSRDVGFENALHQQGYIKGKKAFSKWREDQVKLVADVMENNDITFKQLEEDREHMKLADYKKAKSRVQQMENALEYLDNEIARKEDLVNGLNYLADEYGLENTQDCINFVETLNDTYLELKQQNDPLNEFLGAYIDGDEDRLNELLDILTNQNENVR